MGMIAAAVTDDGVRNGLLVTAFGFGLRHGIDWDHLAAIGDLTSTQVRTRRALLLATLYAAGHALVVFVLGVLAIMFSEYVPPALDDVMGRIVGVTLLALGLHVIYALVKHGRAFRMRSRWMLVGDAARRGFRWARERRDARDVTIVIEHDHEHDAEAPHHEHAAVTVGAAASDAAPAATDHRHRHWHRHEAVMPEDPFGEPRKSTAFGVGMLHGVGAETPTQVLIFLTAAGAAGRGAGVLVLVCFIAGLLVANSAVAIAAAAGVLRASTNFVLYVAVSVVIASFSLAVGGLSLFGRGDLLPTLLAG